VTSTNTGVPDISGSVYNKTQVSKTGPSSIMSWGQASGSLLFPDWSVSGAAGRGIPYAGFAVGVESVFLSHRVPPAVSAPEGAAGVGAALYAAHTAPRELCPGC